MNKETTTALFLLFLNSIEFSANELHKLARASLSPNTIESRESICSTTNKIFLKIKKPRFYFVAYCIGKVNKTLCNFSLWWNQRNVFFKLKRFFSKKRVFPLLLFFCWNYSIHKEVFLEKLQVFFFFCEFVLLMRWEGHRYFVVVEILSFVHSFFFCSEIILCSNI